jgi:hypothetical protein
MKVEYIATDVQPLIRGLLQRGAEVWLIGSRANGYSKPESDWDFIVFGEDSLVQELSKLPAPDNVDVLVVTDGKTFRSPWPRKSDGAYKQGELEKWQWLRKSSSTATYESTKVARRLGHRKKRAAD